VNSLDFHYRMQQMEKWQYCEKKKKKAHESMIGRFQTTEVLSHEGILEAIVFLTWKKLVAHGIVSYVIGSHVRQQKG